MSEERPKAPASPEPTGEAIEMTYREAVKAGIRDAMNRDSRVFLMGESYNFV